MKFKQGRLLEGTRVSFHLSHQRLVNRGSSSAAAGLPEPCQFSALQLAALQAVGGGGEERRVDPAGSCRLPLTRQSPSTGGAGMVQSSSTPSVRSSSAGALWRTAGPSHAIVQVLPISCKLVSVPGGLSGQLL